MKLKEKIALITGSSSGIGKAVAELYAKEGANVIVCSNKTVEEGKAVVKSLRELGSDSIYMQCDLTKEFEVKNLFNQIKEKYGKLDILVNNAGRTTNIAFKDTDQEALQKEIDVNFTSTFLCSKYATEIMSEGHIINTSSIRGTDYAGRPGIIGYCAGKAAVNSFTKQLALELAPKIYVNAVAPGFVHSKNIDNMPEEIKQKWVDNIPLRRFINPEEIAEVYLLLATSIIFTGSIITPDCGYTILNR